MAKTPDIDSARGIGEISSILHNQGIADLSWLAVNEEEYRAAEALPKQNLDCIPELQRALTVDPKEDDVPHLIPLRPHVIVNRNPLSNEHMQTSETDQTVPIRNRVARYIMANLTSADIERRIRTEFAPGDIRIAAGVIREIMNERGVLGNVYIDARHFPNAHRDPKERKYATTFGKNAIFVIAGCGSKNGCNCHQTGTCSTFGSKRVVNEVPWSASVAAHYAPRLAAEKRSLSELSGISAQEWKENIRSSFLKTPIVSSGDGVRTIHTQYATVKPKITNQDISNLVAKNSSGPKTNGPSSVWIKYARRMMHGVDDRHALVASTDPEIRALASEYGILGHTYLDMDALGGCRNTLAFMNERGGIPDFVIRRSASCSMCSGVSDGACMAICSKSKISMSKDDIGYEAFASSLDRAVLCGRISSTQAESAFSMAGKGSAWEKLVSQINLHQPASIDTTEYSGIRASVHNGDPGRNDANVTTPMNPEEIRRTLSHLMNLGFSGKALRETLLKRYSTEDLRQVPGIGRRASLDDGIQGQYFIDPTAYADYGKGCASGSKHFRKRGAPNVIASGSCTGCTLQTAPGWCSKYAKSLIRQVPIYVREQVAASRKLPVIQSAPVENPVERYELSSELTVDFGGTRSKGPDLHIPGNVI